MNVIHLVNSDDEDNNYRVSETSSSLLPINTTTETNIHSHRNNSFGRIGRTITDSRRNPFHFSLGKQIYAISINISANFFNELTETPKLLQTRSNEYI